jgi:hypothetical protein
MNFDITSLPDIYQPDLARIDLAKARQVAVFRGETPDRWPIVLWSPLTAEQEQIPSANYAEAFEDIDRMLCSQVRSACSAANSGSDAVPSIRGNYGVGVLLSVLGLQQLVYADKMPWPNEHLTQEQVEKLVPGEVETRGTFATALEFMRRHREIMGNTPPAYCLDTQGPFDLAHLVMGDDIFYAMHDAPELVHHLLEWCVSAIIQTSEQMKAISGEGHSECHHSNHLYGDYMGVRICEDTTLMISPDAMQEFAMPYTQRVAQHFGGAWVHYCGQNDHLSQFICDMPEIRAINFGHVPGNDYIDRFAPDLQRCVDTGTVYVGDWPKCDGETSADYLRRLHEWSSQGALIPNANAAITDNKDDFATAEQVLDFWYSL